MRPKPRESIELVERFATPPAKLYAMWLHPVWHGKFTGGAEAVMEPKVGELYSAWDGYIEGAVLVLEEPHRIVQSWRTADFAATDKDSRLELLLEADGEGTRLTLRHTELPPGTSATYTAGWEDHYFVHMREVLGVLG
ncbi:hypothetical protein LBMAG42_00860 [Deltaproteobacteria bacterium]|nr:hypothetical protein LBMAG42_00860 [Deltaproteobacteria bacterium]